MVQRRVKQQVMTAAVVMRCGCGNGERQQVLQLRRVRPLHQRSTTSRMAAYSAVLLAT
jgi:hypothetical protein